MSDSQVRNVFGVHSVDFSIAAAVVAGLANPSWVTSSHLEPESRKFWSTLVTTPSNSESRGVEVIPLPPRSTRMETFDEKI